MNILLAGGAGYRLASAERFGRYVPGCLEVAEYESRGLQVGDKYEY